MRWRIFIPLSILAAGISLRSVQPALADLYCPPNLKFSFPPTWYTLSVKKIKPEQPIVKQQLEELAARGDLPKAPSEYDAEFNIEVDLFSGSATYVADEPYYTKDWVCDKYNKNCKYEKVKHHNCVTQPPVTVYRSIKQVKFVLFPDAITANWYKDLSKSPTVAMLYPNYWAPVVLGEGGQPVGNASGELGGPHFFYSDPQLINQYMFPSKLPMEDAALALINPDDSNTIDPQVPRVIPVCSLLDGKVTNSGYAEYKDGYVDSDIDLDPYYCGESMVYDPSGTKIQKLTFDVTQYDFDFPATFYLGLATEFAPALSPLIPPGLAPLDGKTEETEITKSELEPSNYKNKLYLQNKIFVYMLVSTPCQTADGGCDMLTPPGP